MSSTEGIPIRRLVVNDPKDMPLHYGETPGGSIFSTTPGGTRIYYDRAFLLSRRDSPMTRSPPHLPFIPEVTLIPEPNAKGEGSVVENGVNTTKQGGIAGRTTSSSADTPSTPTTEQAPRSATLKKEGDDQFSMDM